MAAYNPPSPGKNRRQRVLVIAGIIIFLLLGLNVFLLVGRAEQSRENKELTTQLDESEQLKAVLEKQYYEALSELEELRGNNEELNALIEKQQEDLRAQKGRIEVLLQDRRNLAEARQQIEEMKMRMDTYMAEVNQLRAQNKQLLATNDMLVEEKDSLSSQLENQRATNEELAASQAELVDETQRLEAERSNLRRKVNIASVVKVNDLEVTGQKIRNNGKRATKRFAKNIDELRICFQTEVNEVTEPGAESFAIRIVNPLGETLYVESLGSRVITDNETGEEVRVTQVAEVDYERSAEDICMIWTPNQQLTEGIYGVEVYNKGYLAGSGLFELK